MKIGIALSGCDLGGVCAYSVLQELEKQGLSIAMLSACCVPAATALLYAYGCEPLQAGELSQQFLVDSQTLDMNAAVENLCKSDCLWQPPRLAAAVSAVNVADGKIITFMNSGEAVQSEKIKTYPLQNPCDALKATISLTDGQTSHHYEDCRLCDFCCWYGCPVYPLKMAGIRKVISIAFVPKTPKTPFEALVKQMIAKSASSADVHIPIEFTGADSAEEYAKTATDAIKGHSKRILFRTLF